MIGASASEVCQLSVGSPQGAILSPSIFIILVSDVGLWSEATLLGYADDTTSTVSGKDLNELTKKCEVEAKKVITYMSANKLAANDDKTHIMAIKRNGEKNQIAVQVGTKVIKESPHEKLLGMHVENNLTWTTHPKRWRTN